MMYDYLDNGLQQDLNAMLSEIENNNEFSPSLFWVDLNKKNLDFIVNRGIQNFKRTVSQNYFNWVVGKENEMYQFVKRKWAKRPTLCPLLSRIEQTVELSFTTSSAPVELSPKSLNDYRLYVSYLWGVMKRLDSAKLHKILYEPDIGNPIKIYLKKRLISQDLANSIIEANTIAELETSNKLIMAELGAGSGRLAHACISGNLSSKYFIFDIPPALLVSQWYLSELYPTKKIFKFRSFDDFKSIENWLKDAEIAFFTPNQLAQFPPNYFDIFTSISTLPEMRLDQIELYLNYFQRLSRKYIYLKQWKQWKNPLDGTDFRLEKYKLGGSWDMILDRTDPIVPEFFNRVWKKNN